MMTRPLICLFGLVCLLLGAHAEAEERPLFFAMDTAARQPPTEAAAVLAELGYGGFGGSPATAKAFAIELAKRNVRFVNAYHVTTFSFQDTDVPADLVQAIDALAGLDTTLWLGLQQVQVAAEASAGPTSGDAVAVPALERALVLAKAKGVKLSLYPHAGFWGESVETCLRVADAVNDRSLGITFNLCHWLKVEGGERDPAPVLKAALPRLDFVTICGADAGDTRTLGWDRLIQPLGHGTYDVGTFLAKLRAAGYRGPIGFQGYGIQMDSKELLTLTMDAWKTFPW
jgi:sugar phosphate isomerase/epimerase